MAHDFHKFWLKVTAIVIVSFGPLFFRATIDGLTEPVRFTMNLISWPLDGATTFTHPDVRFVSAFTAGLLVRWGAMIRLLSAWVYDFAPDPVRRTVVWGALA